MGIDPKGLARDRFKGIQPSRDLQTPKEVIPVWGGDVWAGS